jgi:hypothetical protein
MTCNITVQLQEKIVALVSAMKAFNLEASAVYNAYWDTDASTLVPALPNGTDAATVASKLNKTQFINAMTFSEEVGKFFGNVALSGSDRLGVCSTVRYGSTAAGSQLSEATEGIGDRLKQLCVDAITILGYAKEIQNQYFKTEISTFVSPMSTASCVPGSSMSKDMLVSAVTLCEEFEDFMDGSAITTGDYLATLHKWDRLEA